MSNILGSFSFVDLVSLAGPNGAPALPREVNEIIQRAGVNGTGVRRMGIKADPFQMASIRDSLSVSDGIETTKNYVQLTKDPAQSMVWRGFDYESIGLRFIVLDVGELDVQPVRNKVGGLEGTDAEAAIIRAIWTLQPVEISHLGGQLTNG